MVLVPCKLFQTDLNLSDVFSMFADQVWVNDRGHDVNQIGTSKTNFSLRPEDDKIF